MANKHTVTAITDNLSQLITNLNQTAKDAGGTDRLTTTQDSDLVGAINELDAEDCSAKCGNGKTGCCADSSVED